MPICAALNCNNRCEKGFRLFRLPSDEHRRNQWLVNMGRETWIPRTKSTYLCEVHFEDSQFEQNRADGWKKLKPNAIPCLFKNLVVPITVFKTDIFRICRICLRVHDNLIHLFKPMPNNQIPFTELMEHTPLQVSSDDNLPPYICNECFETLQVIKSFKEKCIHSDNLLKNYNGPNTFENLIEYVISKTKDEGIWYIDNEEDLEISTVNKQNHAEEIKPLNNEVMEKLDKLDEFLDEQLEILEGPIKKIRQSLNDSSQKIPFHKKRIQPMKPPLILSASSNPNTLPVITEVIKLPKAPWAATYELQDFICHICGRKVKYLDSHMRIHNNSMEYKCEVCGKKFNQTALLRKHSVVHKSEKKYECGICHMAFTRVEVRNRHIQTVHQKIRQFKCTICPKAFHLAYRLKVHMITHTGEKSYKCNIEGCTREYKQRSALVNHLQKYHSSDGLRCEICNKVFKQKRYLAKHMRLHDANEDKIFQCTLCLREFQKQIIFQEHLRNHTGDRPAKCNKCDESFVSDRVLKKHMKLHINTVERQDTVGSKE
ncbi:zinc finger protein 208-like [Chrysoperla carnea]|uniref:zinc finger protein 208-like n=1 Tax=Chrysoperla carnea TaxID=189513 RepID=UPI001D06F478|nr:zinc finger protein 208-like [Chrysoperla carnea]